MKFSYQAEKFSAARRYLMLPHPKGESDSIALAFHECKLGLLGFNRTLVDDNAANWISALDNLMATEGLQDHAGEGLYLVKAKTLSYEEKCQLASIIDELAYWFSYDH